MTIQTVLNPIEDRQQRMTPLLLIGGGAALVLAVAAGISLWASADRGVEPTAGVQLAAPLLTEPLSEGTAPAIGGMAELYRNPGAVAGTSAVRPGRSPTVYVAASAAQAEAQRSLIDATNAGRARLGGTPLEATVVVAGSLAELEHAARMLAELNAFLAVTGLPGILLVVLPDHGGTQIGEIAPAGAAATVAGPPFTVFLVESEEAAGRLAEEFPMLMPAGGVLLPSVSREQIVIAGTSEQAATAWVIIEGLRTTHGRDGVLVVDWRSRPTADRLPLGGGAPPLSAQSAGMP
jgi:hypothetical protein